MTRDTGGQPATEREKAAEAVWDALDQGEQRDVFLSLFRASTAYENTQQVGPLTRFAESITGMVRLETTTNLRQILRNRAAGGHVRA